MKIVVTPNEKLEREIRYKLSINNGYCPCATEHNTNYKCMCKDFRDLDAEGTCHCGLYSKIKDSKKSFAVELRLGDDCQLIKEFDTKQEAVEYLQNCAGKMLSIGKPVLKQQGEDVWLKVLSLYCSDTATCNYDDYNYYKMRVVVNIDSEEGRKVIFDNDVLKGLV